MLTAALRTYVLARCGIPTRLENDCIHYNTAEYSLVISSVFPLNACLPASMKLWKNSFWLRSSYKPKLNMFSTIFSMVSMTEMGPNFVLFAGWVYSNNHTASAFAEISFFYYKCIAHSNWLFMIIISWHQTCNRCFIIIFI